MIPVHHMIAVRDLDRAIAFYERALEFKVAEVHYYDGEALAYLRGNDSPFEIELIMPRRWPYAEVPETGRSHIAFAVADLDSEHARLAAAGIAAGAVTDYRANGRHQTRYFYVTDPEGNQIEFLEARGRYAAQGGSR